MPNTTPVNDSVRCTRWMCTTGGAAPEYTCSRSPRRRADALTDFAALKSAGAVAVTDDGRPILKDGGMMREALAAAARVRDSP